jgi:glycosyltransferase involved in cell wall biosynthesis
MFCELPQMKYREQKGLVSIIVPIYNNEISLRECLNSILMQTFENWEAILVNDGSTDNTGKIIDEYVEKDSRFVAIHKQNEGTLLARKTGLENSRGEFIANIDHDDTYNSQFLEKMHAKITETNADFVCCRCQEIADKKYSAYYSMDYEWNEDVSRNVAMMLTSAQGMSWLTWDKLIKREIYAKVNFPNTHIIIGEDPIQITQVTYYSKSAAFVSENLYFHKLAGFTTTQANNLDTFRYLIILYRVLDNLFDGVIPYNVKRIFSLYWCNYEVINAYYFCLDKKQRLELKNELGPFLFLLEFIKLEKTLNLKICLLLAYKGIKFPLRLRQWLEFKLLHLR